MTNILNKKWYLLFIACSELLNRKGKSIDADFWEPVFWEFNIKIRISFSLLNLCLLLYPLVLYNLNSLLADIDSTCGVVLSGNDELFTMPYFIIHGNGNTTGHHWEQVSDHNSILDKGL